MGEIGDTAKSQGKPADPAKVADGAKVPDAPKVQEPSLAADLWQSLKYSFVQKPYDGLSQLANHLGADMEARNLVDKPITATSTSHKIAQGIGAGLGELPAVIALYAGARGILRGLSAGTASSFSIACRENLTVNSLTMSGVTYDGLTTPSREGHFLSDRINAASVGGLTMYAMGKTQLRFQNAAGLAGSELSADLLVNIGQRAKSAGFGAISGSVGGFVNAETSSILYKHRRASVPEIESSMAKYAGFGFLFGGLTQLPQESRISPGFTGAKRTPRGYAEMSEPTVEIKAKAANWNGKEER